MILLDLLHSGKDYVVTTLLGQDGRKMQDTGFFPYFYLIVEAEKALEQVKKVRVNGQPARAIEQVKKLNLERGRMAEVDALKIVINHPRDMGEWREAVKPFGERREMDIPFVRRYMIDHELAPLVEVVQNPKEEGVKSFVRGKEEIHNLKVLAFDIETLGKSPTEIGNDPISMISVWGKGLEKVITWAQFERDKKKEDWLEIVNSEAEVIKTFVRMVNEYRPEVIVGYNSDAFDWPFIQKRAEKLGVTLMFGGHDIKFVRRGKGMAPCLPGMNPIDLYVFVKNLLAPYMQSETLDLNTVSQELVGEGKVQIGGVKGMQEAWNKNPAKLFEYSLQDSKVTYLLAHELLPMIYELAKTLGQPLFDVARLAPGQTVEWLLIREAVRRGMLIPERPKNEVFAERMAASYVGAFVKEPLKGLHKRIAVCDFRSLYPTIIISHNISPEMMNCNHPECRKNSIEGVCFCKKEEGFLSGVMKDIFEERMRLKDSMKGLKKEGKEHEWKIVKTRQNALKLILNSFYGYLGFPGSRWYTLEAARAITAWGREYIKQIMEMAEKEGFTVIYGDTDSIMLGYEEVKELEDFERKVGEFMEKVNAHLPEPMKLELEGFFRTGLFVTKKRYALMGIDGSMVVKGLERVRRDWSPLARKAQEEVLRLVLNDRVDEAVGFVKEKVNELRRKEVPMEDLVITTQLTKLPEHYATINPHVKVAKDLRKMGEPVVPGMLVEYIVTPGSGKAGESISSRAVWAEIAQDYDVDYYVENQLLPVVSRILQVFGETEQSLKSQQSGLGSFM